MFETKAWMNGFGLEGRMMKNLEGKLIAKGLKFGIVVSRFNSFIGDRLLEGAMDALKRSGAEEKDCTVAKVPGAFEIPLAAKKMAKTGRYDAVLCLGCVIRGATPHFSYIAAEVTKGIASHFPGERNTGGLRGPDYGYDRTGH